MRLLMISLVVVISSLDTLLVAIVYGKKSIPPFTTALVYALMPSCGTYLAMLCGKSVYRGIPASLANLLGGIITLGMGCYLTLRTAVHRHPAPPYPELSEEKAVLRPELRPQLTESTGEFLPGIPGRFRDNSALPENGDFRETILISLALTLNNLLLGFVVGLMNTNIGLIAVITFLISLLMFYTGTLLGKHCLARLSGEKCDLVVGILMIILSAYEFFG